MTILIGLGGYAKSGKDAFADALVKNHDGFKEYMSHSLEEALLRMNPWVYVNYSNWEAGKWPQNLHYYHYERAGEFMRYRELHTLVGYERSKACYDVRVYLQKLGTDVGRDMCGENVWVDHAMRSVDEHLAAGTPTALTGIRYHNELDAIHERKGLGIWVSRPGYGPVNQHSSDNTLSATDFDVVVNNDRTLEDLSDKADEIINNLQSAWRAA